MDLELKIEDGIVKVNKWKHHYKIAEPIANDVCLKLYGEYRCDEWLEIVKIVMTELASKSEVLKSKIVADVRYSLRLNEEAVENVKMPFSEAKAYVKGYNNAVNSFEEVFDNVEKCFKQSLDKFLQSS